MKNVNVIVKEEFLDRYTGKMRKVNERFTVKEDRYREILRSGNYVEVVKDEAKKPEIKKESK